MYSCFQMTTCVCMTSHVNDSAFENGSFEDKSGSVDLSAGSLFFDGNDFGANGMFLSNVNMYQVFA